MTSHSWFTRLGELAKCARAKAYSLGYNTSPWRLSVRLLTSGRHRLRNEPIKQNYKQEHVTSPWVPNRFFRELHQECLIFLFYSYIFSHILFDFIIVTINLIQLLAAILIRINYLSIDYLSNAVKCRKNINLFLLQ